MRRCLLPLLVGCALLSPAHAEHLGTIGPTYTIGEESALDLIMRRLKEKEKSGELKRLQQEATRRSLNSLKHPVPVAGISRVMVHASRVIDPSVTYQKAITDDMGRTVVPAGTRINPLEHINLSKSLVFFDGRDSEQLEAVRALVQKYQAKVKPVLVAGSWLETTRAWKTQVYYDQNGTLSHRFGITAVPAVIRQQGKALVLEEIPAKELR